MNDFKKKELERILEGITWWLDGDNALYNETLINKIQSMIDNYCDHEWKESAINAIYCSHCQKLQEI